MEKITQNCSDVIVASKTFIEREKSNGVFARDLFNSGLLKDKTFNCVNATLASLVGKGYFTKSKQQYGDGESAKIYTFYQPTKKLLDYKKEQESE